MGSPAAGLWPGMGERRALRVGGRQRPPSPAGTGVAPVGRLSQAAAASPIVHLSASGWRTEVHEGAVKVIPPAFVNNDGYQYVACGAREALGDQAPVAWESARRSLLLSGGAKLTMHADGDILTRVSLYDGDESHEIDVLAQVVTASRVDPALAASREAGEHDGDTAFLDRWLFVLMSLYAEPGATDGTPLARQLRFAPLARQDSATRGYAYDARTLVPADEVTTACEATVQPRGGMAQALPGGMLEYTTRSGEWNIKIDVHNITATRIVGGNGSFTWQVWGDPHENLNGKHIKDWNGKRRTLLLDDGARITMHADGPHHVVHTTSIYDGPESHEIGNHTNELRHSCVNTTVAQQREAQEADGETAYLAVVRSPDSAVGALMGINLYDQADVGGELEYAPVPLGITGEYDVDRQQVHDLYDDPRLGHT